MEPQYSVIIKPSILPREMEFLSLFCHKITSPSELSDLLEFRCTKINVSHHSYIEMEILTPNDQVPSVLRIPHYMVFLIVGSEDRRSIGYGV
jgi:hypothetical protein